MSFSIDVKAITATALAALQTHARTAAGEWLREARAALPAAWLGWLGRHARPVLTLGLEQGEVHGRLEGERVAAEATWPLAGASIKHIAEWLKAQQLGREEVKIEVELEPELFLQRKMVVPRAALDSLPAIVVQDIVHRTPFDPAEIWHAAAPGASTSGPEIVDVEHWIIRRDRARAALVQLGLAPDDIDALIVAGSEPRAIIPLRESSINDAPWGGRLGRAAIAAAIAITLLGAITVEWVASGEVTRIADAVFELRSQGSAGSDPAAQLLAIKAGPGVLEVWDELSRRLPDHTYLSELRVADGNVTIAGFSADAAHLVRLLDQSALFTAARLTGPITPDKAESKDRFTLAFRLRGTPAPPERPGTAVARSEP